MNQLMQIQEKLQSRVLSTEERKSLKGKGCGGRRRNGCEGGGKRRRNGGGCSSGGGTTPTVDTTPEIVDPGTTPILGVGFDL